jgi:hypothetical protein
MRRHLYYTDNMIDPSPPAAIGLYYQILLHCSSVREAITVCNSYSTDTLSYQILVADRTGAAAIISPDADGALHVTKKPQEDPYLVASTINAATDEAVGRLDARRRLKSAERILSAEQSDRMTGAQVVLGALEATQRKRCLLFGTYTMYSAVFSSTDRVLEVRYLSDFDTAARLKIDPLLDGAPSVCRISELISREATADALSDYETTQRRGRVHLAFSCVCAAGLSVVAAFLIRQWRRGHG